MAIPLLKTKLYIPSTWPELVPRPRLIERLDEGVRSGCKLTLLSAPAGFGKTTLLSEWVRRRGDSRAVPVGVAWLSLGEDDDDLVRFLTYLVAALQTIDGNVGKSIQNTLRSQQRPAVEEILTALINQLDALSPTSATGPGHRLALVLDDYHLIQAQPVHEALAFLLDHLPPHLHLAIATRQDPPLFLSRLRARGQLTEIRQDDLRFTPAEAAAFLNQAMGLDLTVSEVAALEERTEGWIAGLQMAALALESTERGPQDAARFIDGFSGRHHFVLDYLTDEVLERQPPFVRQFLLQTSILERMCGPLCDAVLARQAGLSSGESAAVPPSQAILESLERANLFLVSLDGERRWYRYHRLFGELLQARQRTAGPEQIAELHRRAALWYDQNDLVSEAVHHALAANDADLAGDAIERAVQKTATWSSVNVATFMGWLNALPGDVVRARPWMQLLASRSFYVTGQGETAERMLQALERWLEHHPAHPDAIHLSGLVVADRASYAAVRGDVRQAIALARQALDRLPEESAMTRIRAAAILGLAHSRTGNVSEASQAYAQAIDLAVAADIAFTAVPFACSLADAQFVQGRLEQAIQSCERARQLGIINGEPTPEVGFAHFELAKILYERNDLRAAERHASEGLPLLVRGGTADSFGTGHAILARVRQAQGDDARALAAIQQAMQSAQKLRIPRILTQMSAHQARIWLAQGQLERAARWARDYRQTAETEYLREFEELTLARVLLAEDRPSEAAQVLDPLLSPAEAAGRMGTVIETLALRALALDALDDREGALNALERALELAEPESYVRVYVDGGEPMAQLLRAFARSSVASSMVAYVSTLLAAFAGPASERADVRPSAASGPSPLVEPLTGREMEVLECLAQGLTNREIGRQLYISLPTVKSHTRNLYGKLGVHGRRQAVAKARALGILPYK